MRTSITQAVADVATPTRSGAAAPIADRAGGVFLVYEGVHLLAGLLLFPKLPTVYLLRQPHTVPSVILIFLCCPGRHGSAPSKFHSSDCIMRFLALSSTDKGRCRGHAPEEEELWNSSDVLKVSNILGE